MNEYLSHLFVDEDVISYLEKQIGKEREKWEREASKWTVREKMKELETLVTIEHKINSLEKNSIMSLDSLLEFDATKLEKALMRCITIADHTPTEEEFLIHKTGIYDLSTGERSDLNLQFL